MGNKEGCYLSLDAWNLYLSMFIIRVDLFFYNSLLLNTGMVMASLCHFFFFTSVIPLDQLKLTYHFIHSIPNFFLFHS